MGDYERGCEFDEGYEQGLRVGAAIAFGILRMAEAIRRNYYIQNCPICKKSIKNMFWTGRYWVCDYPCSWDLKALALLENRQ